MEFLKVDRNKVIASSGAEVRLRGVCVSGYLHMENYIHGFPGAEVRACYELYRGGRLWL